MGSARIAGVALALQLVACATIPQQTAPPIPWAQRLPALRSLSGFELQGRIAASNGADGFSAGLRWQQQGDATSIDLTAALGFGAAHIEQSDQKLRVTTSKGLTLENAEASDQLAATLGFAPPLKSLRFWILGASDPASVAAESVDAQQRLAHLQQGGWQVDYTEYALVEQQWLPRSLTVTHAPLRLRVVVDAWHLHL